MSKRRIIIAATVTTGEKGDGKQLETLIKRSIEARMEVETVIGDVAYSEKGNIEFTKDNEIKKTQQKPLGPFLFMEHSKWLEIIPFLFSQGMW